MSGIGRRFLDAGYNTPKPLLEVDGKKIIEHVLNLFPGVEDVLFICNEVHLSETNMFDILSKLKPNGQILQVPNENRKGPVDAIKQVESYIKDEKEILVSYCDYGTIWDFQKFMKYTEEQDLDGAIPCYTGFHPHMLGTDDYAYCEHNKMILTKIQEKKPFTKNKMEEYASNGTYYFKSGILMKKYFDRFLKSGEDLNNEYYVSMVYNFLVEDGLKVGIFEIEKMLQWGTPHDFSDYIKWSNYFRYEEKKNIKIKNPIGTSLILPLAGKGIRFVDEGYITPKPLLKIDGLPMVVKAVECLPKSDDVVFICLKEHIDNYHLDKKLHKFYENSKIVSLQDVTQGQACTCELGIKKVNLDSEKPIMISACDNGVVYDEQEYLNLLADENIDIIVWTFRNEESSRRNPNAYAWLEVDKDNRVKHVSCKKFIYDDISKTHAIIGTIFFRQANFFLDGLKKNYEESITTNEEYYVDDVLNQNIKSGLNVKVFEVKNYLCWGTPNDYKTYTYWKQFFDKKYW